MCVCAWLRFSIIIHHRIIDESTSHGIYFSNPTCMPVCIHVCMYTWGTYVTYMCVHICMYINTFPFVCDIYVRDVCAHAYMHARVYSCMVNAYTSCNTYACACVCLRARMYVRRSMHGCPHVSCVQPCAYLCMHVHDVRGRCVILRACMHGTCS